MKFEENRDSVLTFKKNQLCFVYFLLQDEEVVYVGQTSAGLSRPFSHTDKEYDTIKVIPVKPEGLDLVEDHFISKYKPKYNKKRNYGVVYSLQRANRIIRADLQLRSFKLRDLNATLALLGITPFLDEFTNLPCITLEQLYEVEQHIRSKYERISQT